MESEFDKPYKFVKTGDNDEHENLKTFFFRKGSLQKKKKIRSFGRTAKLFFVQGGHPPRRGRKVFRLRYKCSAWTTDFLAD
jgi:hypothetical protein